MATKEQIRKPATDKPLMHIGETPGTSHKGEKIKAELDDLLDEVDGVLEAHAEEFVRNYVQKGGQ